MFPKTHAKLQIGGIAAILGLLAATLSNGVPTAQEWVNFGIGVLTAAGIWYFPELPSGIASSAKTVAAALGAAATVLETILSPQIGFGAIKPVQWIEVGIAVVTVFVVHFWPNEVPVLNAAEALLPGVAPTIVADASTAEATIPAPVVAEVAPTVLAEPVAVTPVAEPVAPVVATGADSAPVAPVVAEPAVSDPAVPEVAPAVVTPIV